MCDKMAISAYILKIVEKDPFFLASKFWKFWFWLPNFGLKRSLLRLLNSIGS